MRLAIVAVVAGGVAWQRCSMGLCLPGNFLNKKGCRGVDGGRESSC